jgi:hypothetical protein
MNKYVTIGRLEVGISTPCTLEAETYTCGCRFVSVGPLFALLRAKDCRCDACEQYACDCPGSEE